MQNQQPIPDLPYVPRKRGRPPKTRVEIEENEAVRQGFLEDNQGFKPAELPLESSFMTAPGAARTWPHRDGTDGFFICGFERRSE